MDSIITFLGVLMLAITGWAFHLQSKVNVQSQTIEDLKELIIMRFDASDNRLTRIEAALNGSLKR